jgi:hypothetical protein
MTLRGFLILLCGTCVTTGIAGASAIQVVRDWRAPMGADSRVATAEISPAVPADTRPAAPITPTDAVTHPPANPPSVAAVSVMTATALPPLVTHVAVHPVRPPHTRKASVIRHRLAVRKSPPRLAERAPQSIPTSAPPPPPYPTAASYPYYAGYASYNGYPPPRYYRGD